MPMSKITDESKLNLYKIIWKRTVASQMSNHTYDIIKINIGIDNKSELFIRKFNITTFDGWKKLYKIDNNDSLIKIYKKLKKPIILIGSKKLLIEQMLKLKFKFNFLTFKILKIYFQIYYSYLILV